MITPGLGLRPPLLALLLAPLCRADKAPHSSLQLIPALAAALAAVFAGGLSWSLARCHGRSRANAELAALIAGLAVGLHGGLFWCSVRLLTEPLEAALVLAACWGLCANPRRRMRSATSVFAGLALGLLILARAEGLLTGPLIAALLSRRGSRRLVVAGWAVIAIPWLSWSALHLAEAPAQSWLLQVGQLDELMWGSGAASTGSAGEALGRSIASAGRLISATLQPKDTAFLALLGLLLGLWECRRVRSRIRAEAILVGIAAAMILGKAAVWATSDPLRFAILPSLILISLGAAALARLPHRRVERRLSSVILLILLFLGPGQRLLKRQSQGRPESGAWSYAGWGELVRSAGGAPIACSSPWCWTLEGGGPAALLPNQLSPDEFWGFLRATRVRLVLLGENVRHPTIADAPSYGALLQSWGWTRPTRLRADCELWRAPSCWASELESGGRSGDGDH